MSSKVDRKKIKPVIEKRRRSRINKSLSELKSLVLKGADRETTRYAKLEKADILELAVEYIKASSQMRAIENSQLSASRYKRGYERCASEIASFLRCNDCIDESIKSNILAKIGQFHEGAFAATDTLPTPFSEVQRAPIMNGATLPFEMANFKVMPSVAPQVYGYVQMPYPVTFLIPQQMQMPKVQKENLDTIKNTFNMPSTGITNQSEKIDNVWRPWERNIFSGSKTAR